MQNGKGFAVQGGHNLTMKNLWCKKKSEDWL